MAAAHNGEEQLGEQSELGSYLGLGGSLLPEKPVVDLETPWTPVTSEYLHSGHCVFAEHLEQRRVWKPPSQGTKLIGLDSLICSRRSALGI